MASALPTAVDDIELEELEDGMRTLLISESVEQDNKDKQRNEEGQRNQEMPDTGLENAGEEEPKSDSPEIDVYILYSEIEELLKCKEESLCKIEEIVARGTQLETLMLKNKDSLVSIDKILYWLKLGQLYCLTHTDKQCAIDVLSKVVKLDPTKHDAWNSLAECYWQLEDYEMAKTCLENSLEQVRCRIPLRNLSIIYRKLAMKDVAERTVLLKAGINFAKQAVEMDVRDGVSWGILGNAYLSAYFASNHDVTCAKLALSAYKQAVNSSTTNHAELHYNQAFTNKYCEFYEEALAALDKALEIESDWEEAIKLKNDIIAFLSNVQLLHNLYGKLRPKKLAKLQKELHTEQICPYIRSLNADRVSINLLKHGENKKMVVFGKIIWTSPQDQSFPFTCGCMEATGFRFVITIYNLTPGRGFLIGDTVYVHEPNFKWLLLRYQGRHFEFPIARVDNPTNLVVNKKRLTQDFYTPYTMTTFKKEHM